jgi:hypothetical protein
MAEGLRPFPDTPTDNKGITTKTVVCSNDGPMDELVINKDAARAFLVEWIANRAVEKYRRRRDAQA